MKRNYLVNDPKHLMGHPPYSPDLALNDFFLLKHIKKKCVVNDFRRHKMLLKRSKTVLCRCLNRSGKTNTNDDRTSKHYEYDYAKKCQTLLWKCQISPGYTRNNARPEIYVVTLVLK